jgi:pyruvate dehydrogenase E2 component (dihydrolipoamide acetyltransferase)
MSIEVTMPQMGESVVEGTVTRWLVKEGDRVQEDQSLCEISTDKVDTEIPSPGAGVIAKLIASEGETLPVGAPLAVIESSGAAAGAASAAPAAAPAGVRTQPKAAAAPPLTQGKAAVAGAPAAARPQQSPPTLRAVRNEPRLQAASAHSASQAAAGGASSPAAGGSGTAATETAEPAAAAAPPRNAQAPGAPGGVAADAHRRYSPVVIRIAEEHGIDLTRVPGTGIGGRVSKRDVLAYLDALQAGQVQPPTSSSSAASGATNGATNVASASEASPGAPAVAAQPSLGAVTRPGGVPTLPGGAGYRPPVYEPREGDVVEPFTRRRKLIAEHMVYSKTHSPHVGTLAEVDLTRVMRLRDQHKEAFLAQEGFTLTLLPLAAAATVRALKEFPRMNASVVGDSLIVRHQINLGIAMDTEEGLLVPVIKAAEEMSVVGLAREIERLRRKIAEKKITADDLAGGSFTLTNPGREGNLFGFAIINQPQVGILRMGEIKKRPVVVEADGEDAVAIRTMMYLALSYDHRVIDGVLGNRFLYRAARILEEADFEL